MADGGRQLREELVASDSRRVIYDSILRTELRLHAEDRERMVRMSQPEIHSDSPPLLERTAASRRAASAETELAPIPDLEPTALLPGTPEDLQGVIDVTATLKQDRSRK